MVDEKKEPQEHEEVTTEQETTSQEDRQEAEETVEAGKTGDEVAELKAQVEEFKDRCLRAYAEMDNMRKRLARERQEIIKFGTEKMLRDFLLVYDAIHKSPRQRTPPGRRTVYRGFKDDGKTLPRNLEKIPG